MKTKTAYKQTEIGEIPEEWNVLALKDLVIDTKSGFASGERDESGIVQFRMNNISSDGKIVLDALLKVPTPQNIEEYLLRKDDVLFNNTNSVELIGKSAIFNGELPRVTFSNHITRIRADLSKTIPKWILYHLIKRWMQGYFRLICVRHVGQAGIRSQELESPKSFQP
jgi:type I restriction enzyme S subunit